MKTVAIDLDGVLAEYDTWRGWKHIGEPIKKGVYLVRRLHAKGYEIVIHTCRMNGQWDDCSYTQAKQLIADWLRKHNIPYHRIASADEGKPFACAYVDDRAVIFSQFGPIESMITRIDALEGKKDK